VNRLFNDLNTIYRKIPIAIIVITVKRSVLTNMPMDAKKTLFFDKISFPSYNALELKDILISRLKQTKIKLPEIKEGTINYIAAIAGQNGSARTLLHVTLKCIQKNNFDHEFIDEVYTQLMHDEWFDFVDEINENEKEFLKVLLEVCNHETETHSEFLEKKIGHYSNARISQLLNIFEKYSVIKTYHKNLGRGGGRKRLIKFTSKKIYEELDKMF